jgi:hypothetical protein
MCLKRTYSLANLRLQPTHQPTNQQPTHQSTHQPKGWTALSYARAKGKYGPTEEAGIYPEVRA